MAYETRAERIAWMKHRSPLGIGLLRVGGVWGMTWGIWTRTGDTSYDLVPFRHTDETCSCVIACNNYAADARAAGFKIKVVNAHDVPLSGLGDHG